MNSKTIFLAVPLLALVAAIAFRQTLGRRQSKVPAPEVIEAASNAREPVASSTIAVETSESPQVEKPASPQLRALGEAIETSYESTVAAFALHGEEADYETHDARAGRDADRLQQLFSSMRPELSTDVASCCEALIDRVTAAQLQLMAFAINRKNRGLPDSAQAEAELADRKAFQEDATPLLERIKPH